MYPKLITSLSSGIDFLWYFRPTGTSEYLSIRLGDCWVRIFLRRDGIVFGRDRVARILRSCRAAGAPKKPRKRYRSQNRQPFVATAPNQVWTYDFVFDGCANGDTLKCLTMVDEFTKESLYIDVAGSIRSRRLIQVLEQLIRERGRPMVLRSGHGPEFLAEIGWRKPDISRYIRVRSIDSKKVTIVITVAEAQQQQPQERY
jgi:transposase InsO family protein